MVDTYILILFSLVYMNKIPAFLYSQFSSGLTFDKDDNENTEYK